MNIEKFCEIYGFGKVISKEKILGGLMHKMFKVETDKQTYCIKILNSEVMARKEAFNNFIISERISNLAKQNGIPASCAINVNGNYLIKMDDFYYMVFDFIDGKILDDNEITIEDCKKIGNILAKIHSLNYEIIGLKPHVVEYKRLYCWEEYTNNSNFNSMIYKDKYLSEYKKYNSILKKATESFNSSNVNQTICHCDMDSKNVMWHNDNPIIIDWESAHIANPERELLETALCWSGFSSNNFNDEKFKIIFREYSKYRIIYNCDWLSVIFGNLVGRFGWLKYNLERSLGIISNDEDEKLIAENEVLKTINEINRYLNLIDKMNSIISELNDKAK